MSPIQLKRRRRRPGDPQVRLLPFFSAVSARRPGAVVQTHWICLQTMVRTLRPRSIPFPYATLHTPVPASAGDRHTHRLDGRTLDRWLVPVMTHTYTHVRTLSLLGQSLGGSWIGFGAWSTLPFSSAQKHDEAWSAHCSVCFLSEGAV